MNFEIGQVFEGEYPPEAAIWCNEIGKVHIEEIEPVDDVQRFQIVANPEPTDDEIADQVRHNLQVVKRSLKAQKRSRHFS